MMVKNMRFKKVPKRIKEFFLYQHWWANIYRKEKCLGLIVVGKTGSGKSWLALRIATDLDPTFDVKTRVVYTAEYFMNLIANGGLTRGQAVIFDELAHAEGCDARAAMSRTNRLLSGVVSTYRQLGLIVIFVLPTLTQLDKNLRMVSIDGYFSMVSIDRKNRRNIAEFRTNDLNVILGKSYHKHAIVQIGGGRVRKVARFAFDAPPKDVVREYRKMKMDFVRYIAKKAANESDPFGKLGVEKVKPKTIKDYADLVMKDISKFSINGQVDKALIEANLGIGRIKAETIKKYVSHNLSQLL
jgi:hypothetical protein